MGEYLSKVWYLLKGGRKEIPLLLLTFCISSLVEAVGVGIIGPFLNLASQPGRVHDIPLLQRMYTVLQMNSEQQFVVFLGFAIAAIFCIKSSLYFASRVSITRFSNNQQGRLASRLLKAYLAAPYTFHLNRNSSSLAQTIIVEAKNFSMACLNPILIVVSNTVIIFALLTVLARASLAFLVIVLAIFIPVFLIFHLFGKKFKQWGEQRSKSQKEMIRVLNHSVGGLKETRVIGCEEYFERQMDKQIQRFEKASTLFQSSQLLPRITLETTLVIAVVLFIAFSSLYQSSQDITSILGVFTVASIRLIPAANQLVTSLNSLRNSLYAVELVYWDLKQIEEELRKSKQHSNPLVASNDGLQLSSTQESELYSLPFTEKIELRDVSYSYPGTDHPAIDRVSLTIRRGQSIALIGKSGAGKTTLVDVILGLLEPQLGDIQVDGKTIYKDIRIWQNLVGYIPQTIFLIDDTIERNIAFGVPDRFIDAEQLKKVIQAAQLEDLIEQLPEGIKTRVGERGVRLSGGQRQRIGIARALYHERQVLVLDEATSALDSETENLITDSLKSLSGQKTMIVIAHRLSTVEHCDQVYLMEKGKVVQSGSYEEVVLSK